MFLPGRCCRRCPHLLLAASSKTFKRKCIVVLQNGQRLILNIYFHLSWTQAESGGNYQVRCVNRLQKKIIYSNLWPDMLLVYYQINYYCIRYQIDQISEDFDSPLCALYCRCDNILWLCVCISRLWCILPYLLRAPRWLLHQLQRGSQARGPWPLCAINKCVLASPVRRPGWGMPSVSQILPQVFRSRQISLPELQPETSPAQWVEFGSWILWSLHVLERSLGICDLFA